MNERGVTLLESLIALVVGSVVLLGVGSLYVATSRSSGQDSAQTFLQRRGVLILDEMARQIRPATDLTRGAGLPLCRGDDINTLKATNSLGAFCFYRANTCSQTIKPCSTTADCPQGEICLSNSPQLLEDRPGGGTENLLAGSPVPLTVSSFVSSLSGSVATVTFQLQDNRQNSMVFTTAFGHRN
jgi:prepilin-type N-terminal cleavage/methylation domain-containing protein